MIVLKVIAYSILIAVLGYFAVMSFIINYEESKCRKYFHSTFHKEEPTMEEIKDNMKQGKSCEHCKHYNECLSSDYKCRYEYLKYFEEDLDK